MDTEHLHKAMKSIMWDYAISVNDIDYRCGVPNLYEFGFVDTPLNILTNKLTAIVGRDDPKDVFDIYALSKHYMFIWLEVFNEAKNKAIINVKDVEQRISSFPIILFQKVDWHILPFDIESVSISIKKIADDFLLGSDNSLGKNKPAIEKAMILNPVQKVKINCFPFCFQLWYGSLK